MAGADADSEAFTALLTELQVPEALQEAVLETGIASASDFAYA